MTQAPQLNRRDALRLAALSTTLAALGKPSFAAGAEDFAPVILLRSGWQTVNIGDIAHTPGVLELLRKYLPKAKVILWSNAVQQGVREMLDRHYPDLEYVSGNITPAGEIQGKDLADACEKADFLLHGSGPSVVARGHVEGWRKGTQKPYGILGVTITANSEAASGALDAGLVELLNGADFVFTRETVSLENLRRAKVEGPVLGFAPDGTFGLKLSDEARAEKYLTENGLEEGKFIAVIPRLRYTPYHKIRKVNWSAEEIERRESINEEHAERDHAKLRAAVVRWVRETGGKALLCPEMTYQTEIIDPLLYDPLPEDIKPHVVRKKDYWITDEASSVYQRAAAVVSCECHSPIIAASVGTPCMYLHQPEDGIKGNMWNDVGLGDWYFPIEETTGEQVAAQVMRIHQDSMAAQRYLQAAMTSIEKRYDKAMDVVINSLKSAARNKS